MVSATLRPRGPYSLRLSARHGGDATRRVHDGVYTASDRQATAGLEQVRAWQSPDGAIAGPGGERGRRRARALRVRARRRPLRVPAPVRRRPPDRRGDPAASAGCGRCGPRPSRSRCSVRSPGQLILASRARQIERAVIRAATPGARRPPRGADGSRPRALLARRARAASGSAHAAARRSSASAARSTSRR